MAHKMERKTVSFKVDDIDEETGVFTGYAATFSTRPDSYGDIIDPGAFKKTLKEGKGRIKVLWNHDTWEPIGKPLEMAEDDKGLLVKGQLSLGVQRAREVLCLMKDGVVNVMSIGFETIKQSYDGGIRHLKEIKLYDVSPVTFAANPEAVILSVKRAASFGDLPLAAQDVEWDATAVEGRVREWAGGEDETDWEKYRKAFFWYDSEEPELFGSYKLGFADILGDKLTAVPRGIFAVAGVLMGARGGVDIPEADMVKVRATVEQYYAKMREEFEDEDIIAPWKKAASVEPDTKAGRVLSASSWLKVQAALDALQALIDSAQEEAEPEKSTLLSGADKEAAKLEAVVLALKAENEGFDVEAAEKRIRTLVAQLNR